MKTVTVQQAQSGFPALLELVARGEEIRVVRRKRPVARIVPVEAEPAPVDWTETWSKVAAIFGGKPVPGKTGSRIIIKGRR